jgi:hypothetical protein
LLQSLLGDEAAFPTTYPRETLQRYVRGLEASRSLAASAGS